VNSTTASAAEIVSGALQDLDRAVLVGQRTFGKGLVQTTRPVGFNAYLKVTTAKYYIPSGRCIQAIDYAHRNEDGSVGQVPDSLVKAYQTAGGRTVYDGGGVMPDVALEPIYTGRFAMTLYAKGYIEDFANQYYKAHREAVDVDRFSFTEADYEQFVAFMQQKEIDFESESQKALSELRKKAEREKYQERIAAELEAIASKLSNDKNTLLHLYREEIGKLLEDEILMRYHYYEGVVRHAALHDPEVRQAIDVLQDTARYHELLTTQDPPKK
ncbi:MAG: S41 family peptidase, partial [Alistipes sp.]|nr:S41 family peptidase [Alistipes sp.]